MANSVRKPIERTFAGESLAAMNDLTNTQYNQRITECFTNSKSHEGRLKYWPQYSQPKKMVVSERALSSRY